MKKLDWKAIGQFMSVLVKLITNIVDNFRRNSSGTEILGWLADDGCEDVASVCTTLVHAYRTKHVLRGVINLGATPKPPYWRFKDPRYIEAEIVSHVTGGKVSIEKRPTGLYLDGKKVVLRNSLKSREFRHSEGCKHPQTEDLLAEVAHEQNLSCTVLDYLISHPEFIPDEWKNLGENTSICFLGTTYSDEGRLTLRYLGWDDESSGKMYQSMFHADGPCYKNCFAVILEIQPINYDI